MENQKTNLIGIRIGSEFGILNDHLFCFDPRFRIRIEEQTAPMQIEVWENKDYMEDFFGHRVSIVTAIVGKNGVGKSTTLRYIKELFIKENRNTEARENDIIFFKDENTIKVFLEQSKRNQFEIINHTRLQTEEIYFRDYPKIFDRIRNFNTIFYSNSLESDPYEKETVNYYNVSTGFLKETIGKINSRIHSKKIRQLGAQKRFRYTELKRQTEFLNALETSSNPPDIPFKRIDHILMEMHVLTDLDHKNIEKIFDGHLKQANGIEQSDENNRKLVHDILKFLKEFRSGNPNPGSGFDTARFFQRRFYENLVYYLIKITFDDRELLQNYGYAPEFGREILNAFNTYEIQSDKEVDMHELLLHLQDLFKKEQDFTGKFNSKESKKPRPHAIIEKLTDTIRLEEFLSENWTNFDYQHAALNLSTRTELFTELFNNHYATTLDLGFLTFKWPALSAGEESLISYFSRLYSVLNDIRNRSALMLIDEGDLYFHPEWQRDYIFYLLEFLNSDLLPSSGIQLIITTHSPFIISDLSKENIILMVRRPSIENTFVVETEQMEAPTFGGNLHTLFSDAFFLGDSATSRFARKKIREEIITPIESNTVFRDRNYIQQLINRVGEPVLRDILQERLERKIDG